MAAARIVSLLTDFGQREPFVGVMKAVVSAGCPGVTLIDLSHEIGAQDVEGAAFWLARAVPFFPRGSVHLVVVDPGVGSARRSLAAAAGGDYFVAPDNGVLGEVLAADPACEVVAIDVERVALPGAGRTFDGRDVFAPAAARLAAGAEPLALGQRIGDWVSLVGEPPSVHDTEALGRVVVVDHFGNLITNLRLDPERSVRAVELQGSRVPWGRSYSDVEVGTAVALTNAWGHLEIALRNGSAAERFGLGRGAVVRVQLGAGIAELK